MCMTVGNSKKKMECIESRRIHRPVYNWQSIHFVKCILLLVKEQGYATRFAPSDVVMRSECR